MKEMKLVLAIAIASAIAVSAAPLVGEQLPQEGALFAQQSELYDELVQEQEDPIFQTHDSSEEDHDTVGFDKDGMTGDDPDLHHRTGDGFLRGGYKVEESNPDTPPDDDHKIIGYRKYRDPLLGDDKIRQPVFKRKKDAYPEDPIIAHHHDHHVDEPFTPVKKNLSEDIGGSDDDYSHKVMGEFSHMDKDMTQKTASKIEAEIDAGTKVDCVASMGCHKYTSGQ